MVFLCRQFLSGGGYPDMWTIVVHLQTSGSRGKGKIRLFTMAVETTLTQSPAVRHVAVALHWWQWETPCHECPDIPSARALSFSRSWFMVCHVLHASSYFIRASSILLSPQSRTISLVTNRPLLFPFYIKALLVYWFRRRINTVYRSPIHSLILFFSVKSLPYTPKYRTNQIQDFWTQHLQSLDH